MNNGKFVFDMENYEGDEEEKDVRGDAGLPKFLSKTPSLLKKSIKISKNGGKIEFVLHILPEPFARNGQIPGFFP